LNTREIEEERRTHNAILINLLWMVLVLVRGGLLGSSYSSMRGFVDETLAYDCESDRLSKTIVQSCSTAAA